MVNRNINIIRSDLKKVIDEIKSCENKEKRIGLKVRETELNREMQNLYTKQLTVKGRRRE